MVKTMTPLHRAEAFCDAYGLDAPILMAPMAGASPPALAAAVMRGGGMGACGALSMDADGIADWTARVRAAANGAFQINTWIPDAPPRRDPAHEARVRAFLEDWGPPVPDDAGDAPAPSFESQCAAMMAAGPSVVSSIMGLYPSDLVAAMKARGIRWFAAVTTVADARAAVEAGADAVVAQGAEAGGHRGTFAPEDAERGMIGTFALVPAVADAVSVPVIATGGIGDARGVAAALMLGASAVQVGTVLLRTPEAGLPAPWADAIGGAAPEDTMATRAFSGRTARAIRNVYAESAMPDPAPYPLQRAFTAPMRAAAQAAGDTDRMQMWAGQSARLARTDGAAELVAQMWRDARRLLAA